MQGFFFTWLRPESNQRHRDFQSPALPTELQSHSREIILKKRGNLEKSCLISQEVSKSKVIKSEVCSCQLTVIR